MNIAKFGHGPKDEGFPPHVAVAFGITAAIAIMVAQFGPRAFFQAVKWVPIVVLLAGLVSTVPDSAMNRVRSWRIAGLLASLVGGIVLETFFAAGTVAFTLAQLCYCVSLPWRSLRLESLAIACVMPVFTFVTMTRLILSAVPPLLYELVSFYALVEALVITGALAHWWSARDDRRTNRMAAGIVLFAISDSILAINRWKFAVFAADSWIQSFYFGGQYLIALSAANGLRPGLCWLSRRR